MASHIKRRDFLKILAGLTAGPILYKAKSRLETVNRLANTGKPNIIVLVYDTLSAEHMPMYGYPRDTTPHLAQFAEQATVFHHHFAAGNFTTPGTASLLTGVYPWAHRAFNIAAPVDPAFEQRSIFTAVGEDYHRVAYTHNLLADYFLHQFTRDIDLHLAPETYFLKGTPAIDNLFQGDLATAYRTSSFLARIFPDERVVPGSLFLSLINEIGLEQFEATLSPEIAALFPEGYPEEGNSKSFFLLEDGIDGMIQNLRDAPQPYLAYFHFYPPHHPYHPRSEFVGRFKDQWSAAGKPPHHFSTGEADEDLNERRRKYDEYLAYADSEFGRLYAYLQQSGMLDNTWVLFTSDHGEMFERGIKGHNTPVLYDPLIRIPLLVHRPAQTAREDIYTSTSCVDVLPTLALAAGQQIPAWCEGQPLPLFGESQGSSERPIFALDARQNASHRPLAFGTIAMIKDHRKFVAYYGYPGFDRQYELYDFESDPAELVNLFQLDAGIADLMKNELEVTLKQVNLPYLA